MTQRVHCKREPYDVYIGRGKCPLTGQEGIWGNPFVIGQHGTRDEVIEKYKNWILTQPQIIKELHTLKGKTLGCWCHNENCHGDVLIDLLDSLKIAVVGSRTFDNYGGLEDTLFTAIGHCKRPIIISGAAGGADTLAREFAEQEDLRLIEFPADWSRGKGAGFERNHYIVNNCDILVAFWDGESKGTQHDLVLAKKAKKPTYIYYF